MQIVFGVNRTGHKLSPSDIRPQLMDSLQAGSQPLNKNLGPSFFRLSINSFTGPSFPLAFITLLLTTSAGAHIVVATVPESAEETKWSGMPFDMRLEVRRASLKKSYETSWEAFIRTARICHVRFGLDKGLCRRREFAESRRGWDGLTVFGMRPLASDDGPSCCTILYTPCKAFL